MKNSESNSVTSGRCCLSALVIIWYGVPGVSDVEAIIQYDYKIT